MKAPKHPNESQRLAALRACDIFDTPRERDFDDIVELTAKYCDMPIALVSLVESDRQWFKAEKGLGVRSTPIDHSICAHAILHDDLFVIPDTLKDDRTLDNPVCSQEGGLRFYAGAQLVSEEGHPLGTLCVLDRRPRTLTDDQQQFLMVMGRQVTTLLELRSRLRRQVDFARETAHRTKNLLAVVQSIFRQSTRNADGLEQLAHTFDARIANLSRVHDALSSAKWEHAELRVLVENVLSDFLESFPGRIHISGDPITVDAGAAENIAVALFELATNAVKYGSLSNEDGRVDLTITADAHGAALVWRETGGPPVSEPRRRGLGLIVIGEVCPAAVHGKASVELSAAGLVWRLTFGNEHIVTE